MSRPIFALTVAVALTIPAGVSSQTVELRTTRKCLVKYQPVGAVAEVRWSGKCKDDGASGKGTLEIVYASLGTDRYMGEMYAGEINPSFEKGGEMTYESAAGVRFVGTFTLNGAPQTGKLFDAQGRLLFDGALHSTWRGGPAPYGLAYGKWYDAEGGYLHGTFVKGTPTQGPGAPALSEGQVFDKTGVVRHSYLDGQVASAEEYHRTVRTRSAVSLAKLTQDITRREGGAAAEPRRYQTTLKCLLAPYPREFVRHVQGLSWSGPCASGKAEGNGIMTVLSEQGRDRYEGAMFQGEPHGKGEMTWGSAGGVRFVGFFVYGNPIAGKFYDSTGALRFDGALHGTWDGGTAPYGFRDGDWYYTNGSYLSGNFPRGALGDGTSTPPMNYAVFHDADGAEKRWVVGTREYPSAEDFSTGLSAYHKAVSDSMTQAFDRDRKRQDALAKAEEKAKEREQRALERQQNGEQSGGLLAGIVGAVAEVIVKSYEPPPPPPPPPPPAPAPSPSGPPPRGTPPSPPAPPPDYRDRQETIAGNGRHAMDCVRVANLASGSSGRTSRVIANGCSDAVEVWWCYVEGDCKSLGAMWTIQPGRSWPLQGQGNIKWYACHGANTVKVTRSGDSFKAICNAP